MYEKNLPIHAPHTKGSFKKRFSSDEAALRFASETEDGPATCGVGKPMEGFWNQKFECFLPVECMAPVMGKIMKLEAEIERLRGVLLDRQRRELRQSYREESLREIIPENHEVGQ